MEIKTADLQNLDTSGFVVYDNGNLAFFDQAHDSNIDTRKVVLPEIFITVLTLRGEASVRVNDVDYTLREHDLLICQPNDLLENLTRSADYECHCVCVSPAYMRQIVPLAENAWAIKFLFKERPVYALNEREAAVFCQYYDQMRSKGYLPADVRKKVIDTLMLALIYELRQILRTKTRTPDPRPFTSAEYLFKQFMDMLESAYPKERSVTFYAERLHVTPKYLSAVCRQVSQLTASQLINRYVRNDIEYLMKHSLKSVKEIAFELGFPNLSFFGKYVKKHWGLSPKKLREKFLDE